MPDPVRREDRHREERQEEADAPEDAREDRPGALELGVEADDADQEEDARDHRARDDPEGLLEARLRLGPEGERGALGIS